MTFLSVASITSIKGLILKKKIPFIVGVNIAYLLQSYNHRNHGRCKQVRFSSKVLLSVATTFYGQDGRMEVQVPTGYNFFFEVSNLVPFTSVRIMNYQFFRRKKALWFSLFSILFSPLFGKVLQSYFFLTLSYSGPVVLRA